MRIPRFRLSMLMRIVAIVIMLTSSAIALVDRNLWIETELRGLGRDRWIESPREWLLLGVPTTLLACTFLGLAMAIRNGFWRRLTTRRLMVAVAVVAIVLAGFAYLQQRSRDHHGLALVHEQKLGTLIISDLEIHLLLTMPQGGGDDREYRERRLEARPLLSFYNYHYQLAEKYQRAAHRPWLPVSLDPSPPPMPSAEYQEALRRRAYEGSDGYVPKT